jgi:hypothetical protein
MTTLRQVSLWLFLGLFLSFASAPASYAKSFQADQIVLLEKTVKQFSDDMSAFNMEGVLKTMPPKLWEFIKTNNKVDDAQLMAAVSTAMKQAFAKVELVGFKLDAKAATTETLADGTQYMLLPTETRMRLQPGEVIVVKSQTLALFEEGKWYFVRIDDAQQKKILTAVYPSFQSVAFPESQTETVKE